MDIIVMYKKLKQDNILCCYECDGQCTYKKDGKCLCVSGKVAAYMEEALKENKTIDPRVVKYLNERNIDGNVELNWSE